MSFVGAFFLLKRQTSLFFKSNRLFYKKKKDSLHASCILLFQAFCKCLFHGCTRITLLKIYISGVFLWSIRDECEQVQCLTNNLPFLSLFFRLLFIGALFSYYLKWRLTKISSLVSWFSINIFFILLIGLFIYLVLMTKTF